jgi:DNA-binding MarR family transcriptional regulator
MGDGFYNKSNYVTQRSLGYLLRHLVKLLEPRAEAMFADEALSFTQWLALRLVNDRVVDNSAGIARMLCHNSGAVTRLVDQLEARGLMERQRDSGDRRIVRLATTPAGVAATESVNPRMIGMWNELLDEFSHSEIETLLSLLGRLVTRLEADEAKESAR